MQINETKVWYLLVADRTKVLICRSKQVSYLQKYFALVLCRDNGWVGHRKCKYLPECIVANAGQPMLDSRLNVRAGTKCSRLIHILCYGRNRIIENKRNIAYRHRTKWEIKHSKL
jgi:hypothetical protein